MLTFQYLKEFGLESLCQKYAIKASRGKKYPNLVLLKYNQIDSPMGEKIVQECRGLIVDESDGWRVVCRAYDKFFNYGEGHAAEIDWKSAAVHEKLDGSIMTLYYYKGEWNVSSSGLPDASGFVIGESMTFADLFWKTWGELGYSMPGRAWRSCCFMFEMMTPANRVLVCHEKPRIVLHGVRDLRNSEFDHTSTGWLMGWETANRFPLGSIEECVAAAKELNPMHAEGYVVCDKNFNRVKVKSPQYVALSHMKEGMGVRRLLEIVRANQSDEFLSYFPEWTVPYRKVCELFYGLCQELEQAYDEIAGIKDQKEFAIKAIKTRSSSPLFALRAGKCESVRDFFSKCNVGVIEKILASELSSVSV